MAALSAIVDPSDAGKAMAAEHSVRWAPSLRDLLDVERPDGVIVATPNQAHVSNGLEAIAAGLPALIEKPIADDIDGGTRLVEAAEAAGVALLVGHHRRHNPMIQKAKTILDQGRLGRVLTAHAMFWAFKPDEYFDVGWRRQAGGGPVFLNLIHDVDNLRYLLGDVISVQARESRAARRHLVEDTAVVLLEFASGALATCSASDTVVAPWSWEHTAGENPAFPREDEFCCLIGGTHGSLSIPGLKLWRSPGKRSWLEPFDKSCERYEKHDPLALQVGNFCRVIRGEEQAVVSGREGLETLKVILAIKQAAGSGRVVRPTG